MRRYLYLGVSEHVPQRKYTLCLCVLMVFYTPPSYLPHVSGLVRHCRNSSSCSGCT